MRQRVVWLITACALSLGPRVFAQEAKPTIRFGLQVAPQQTTIEEMKEVWKEAEALGFDTL
jgi:hypothetical protein